ncbi:MAG: aspartate/glutamate racemase family protein [Actinomycetota bacterium]
MRTIGLLGGMSWESSIEYERIINTEVRDRLGGANAADLLIRSYNFHEIERQQMAGEWEAMGALLAEDAGKLEAAGADVIVLCTNTMHKVADHIEKALTTADFIHLGDTTADAVNAAGVTTVGLLGTRYTMEQNFYRDRLTDNGLTVLVPDEPDRTAVHDIIFEELVQGVVSPASKAIYLEVVERLAARGATGIIAGCTEIELLISDQDVDMPYFPTAALHAIAAVDAALRTDAATSDQEGNSDEEQ